MIIYKFANNFSTDLVKTAECDDEYNPADHRDQIKGQSTGGAMAHFLKSSLGSGILAMPMAFKSGGLLFGMIATLVVGFVCAHCVHILVSFGNFGNLAKLNIRETVTLFSQIINNLQIY